MPFVANGFCLVFRESFCDGGSCGLGIIHLRHVSHNATEYGTIQFPPGYSCDFVGSTHDFNDSKFDDSLLFGIESFRQLIKAHEAYNHLRRFLRGTTDGIFELCDELLGMDLDTGVQSGMEHCWSIDACGNLSGMFGMQSDTKHEKN